MRLGIRASYSNAVPNGGGTPTPTPAVTISGSRMTLVGDSRTANGLVQQDGNVTEFGTTVVMGEKLRGVPTWMNHAFGYKTRVTGMWALGGAKSSECCHDAALAAIAATNPNVIVYLGTTNDPVDYTGTGGLGTMLLGDPLADPITNARVGATRPTMGGVQGTTLGNLDKFLRYFSTIPVIMYEIPTENAGRTQRNADVHKWLKARKAAGTYPNLIAPNLYDQLLATPGADDGVTAAGIWRTDLAATVGVLSGNGGDRLHPSGGGARFLGEAMAADSVVAAQMASLPSQLVLPTGANNAAFLNSNPYIDTQTGGTPLASTGPAATGSIAANFQIRNAFPAGAGTQAVVGSALAGGHGQRITITRTGGSGTTGRTVQFRTTSLTRTLVAGDIYELTGEIIVPARPAGDLFGASAYILYNEPGMTNNGYSVAAGGYESFANAAPDPFPLDGDTLTFVTPQFIVTPEMVSTMTGTVGLVGIVEISLPDNLDTATNGAVVVDVLRLGVRKVA